MSKPAVCPACSHLPSGRYSDATYEFYKKCECPCHALADALVAAVREWQSNFPLTIRTQARNVALAHELTEKVCSVLAAHPLPTASGGEEKMRDDQATIAPSATGWALCGPDGVPIADTVHHDRSEAECRGRGWIGIRRRSEAFAWYDAALIQRLRDAQIAAHGYHVRQVEITVQQEPPQTGGKEQP
jgi:hypothetical protein